MNEDYKRGYREGFLDGYEASKKAPQYPIPTTPLPEIPIPKSWAPCSVCGMNMVGPMLYCCMNPSCPSKVTY